MTKALLLHIGLQKTGTSYLQGILRANEELLGERGLDLVPATRREAFWLMLDVRDRLRSHDPARARDVLLDLERTLKRATGDRALLSEESLAPATDEQIARLLAACGDREVHVVVTCRDLGRQIPSVWQQGLQSGRSISLPDYLTRLRRTAGDAPAIWWQKDVPAVLERWSRHVPPERIHVVTVPPAGSDPGLLLQRFCSVLGIDSAILDQSEVGRANRGLRLEQAEVLRRVNAAVPDELKRRDAWGDVGKRYLSVRILGGEDGRPIRLPRDVAPWCEEVSERYVEVLRSGAYDVVGDPADLLPGASAYSDDDQSVSAEQVADAAVAALTRITELRLEQSLKSPGPRGGALARLRGRRG